MKSKQARKVIPPREKIEFEVGTITLMPVKFQYFDNMTGIINKYFSSFVDATNTYATKRQEILDKYDDETLRAEALLALDNTYNPGYEVARAMLATSSDAAEDAKLLIESCTDTSKENNLEFEDLTIVEVVILLGKAIGLNLNFFNENQEMMGLTTIFQAPEEPATAKTKPKSGGKSLPA